MKRFHWEKVQTTTVNNTIWKALDESDIKFDVNEFENLFSQNTTSIS